MGSEWFSLFLRIFPLFLCNFPLFQCNFPLFQRSFPLFLLKDKGKQQQFTAKMGNFTPTSSCTDPVQNFPKNPGKVKQMFTGRVGIKLAGPQQTPTFQNHLGSDKKLAKKRQKVPKSYFCHFFAYFWPILGSAVSLCPVEGRIVLKARGGVEKTATWSRKRSKSWRKVAFDLISLEVF